MEKIVAIIIVMVVRIRYLLPNRPPIRSVIMPLPEGNAAEMRPAISVETQTTITLIAKLIAMSHREMGFFAQNAAACVFAASSTPLALISSM